MPLSLLVLGSHLDAMDDMTVCLFSSLHSARAMERRLLHFLPELLDYLHECHFQISLTAVPGDMSNSNYACGLVRVVMKFRFHRQTGRDVINTRTSLLPLETSSFSSVWQTNISHFGAGSFCRSSPSPHDAEPWNLSPNGWFIPQASLASSRNAPALANPFPMMSYSRPLSLFLFSSVFDSMPTPTRMTR